MVTGTGLFPSIFLNPVVPSQLRRHQNLSGVTERFGVIGRGGHRATRELGTLRVGQVEHPGRQDRLGPHQTGVKRHHRDPVVGEFVCHMGGTPHDRCRPGAWVCARRLGVARGAIHSIAPFLMAQVIVMPMMGMPLFSAQWSAGSTARQLPRKLRLPDRDPGAHQTWASGARTRGPLSWSPSSPPHPSCLPPRLSSM